MWSRKSPPEDKVSPAGPETPGGGPGSETAPTRRAFLARIGLGATLAGLAGQAVAFVRALLPNVTYEAPVRFKIGAPDLFGEGARFLEDKRLFVFRERNTFHVISAVCTHLGCTVRMQRLSQSRKVAAAGREFEEQVEFLCPCHGSKYRGDGTNYAGPAPKPLAYYRLEVSPDDGQLIVDLAQKTDRDFRLTV
ncbi:MAG TPA: Rieske 2Fe-2S domain-containing protein [Acidobacteriota bacterium]|nr:Rieske 2Fe-2S domain-containing protein [Acidobacteriota bacterium]